MSTQLFGRARADRSTRERMPDTRPAIDTRGALRTRAARPDDAVALVGLLEQLGSPVDAHDLRARIASLANDPTYPSWVVVADADQPIGVASAHLAYTLDQESPTALLGLLLTDSRARGRGIGQLLMDAFDSWARSVGAGRAVISSAGERRGGGHRSYESFGFNRSGSRYSKRYS